eukprot:TRINITY_DN9691_c0_g1_i5.p1 TRINITY_DN9691_c0_g1~~TRINITY_DN9691_c0_g1_i5.p1  ORF type:complete len:394 (-),score=101.70 TRINITY_DN9691_c0_g1_i5:160-1341(-)
MTVHEGEEYSGLMLDQEPEYLSILVSGEMEVQRPRGWSPRDSLGSAVLKEQDDAATPQSIATVVPFEFIDSYEYFARGGECASQVIVKATKDSAVIRWSYAALDDIYQKNPRIQSCMLAMLGQDLIKKFMRMAGREYIGYDDSSDMIRRLDGAMSCFRKAGIQDPHESARPTPSTPVVSPTFSEIVTSLRYANARLLALRANPLESLNPVPNQPASNDDELDYDSQHMKKLVAFLTSGLDIDAEDARNMVKLGKWRHVRYMHTDIVRQGECPYYLGVVIEGKVDALTEVSDTQNKFESIVQENELLGGVDFQNRNLKARQTYKVRSEGAVIFMWESDELRRLMQQDPRLNTAVSKLLRNDHSSKLMVSVSSQESRFALCSGPAGPGQHTTRFC